jgi:hypothetical protein
LFTGGNLGGSGISGIPNNTSGWGDYSNADWVNISYVGNNEYHNNISPCISGYAWIRTN